MVKPNQKTHGFLPLGFQEHPCFLSCWNPGCTALPSCLSANLHPSELAPKILMQPRWLWGAVNIQVGVTNGPGVSESGLSTNLGVLSAEVWSKMQPAKKKKCSLQCDDPEKVCREKKWVQGTTFQRVGEGKKTHGRTSRWEDWREWFSSWRKGAPVIRALPGEIRAEKPQDVFGDFSWTRRVEAEARWWWIQESVGGPGWAAPSMCGCKPGPHVSHIHVEISTETERECLATFIALGH